MNNDLDVCPELLDDEPTILEDFLEFKALSSDAIEYYVNLKRGEISEVVQCLNEEGELLKSRCMVVMKNGRTYNIHESYEKVMELV